MSQHPTDEELFAADSSAKKHCIECSSCAKRMIRLRAGAALIEETAARQSAPPLDWHSLDAIVFNAAEQTAQQVRNGTLKAPRTTTQRVLTVAAPLAMAASAIFGVYEYKQHQHAQAQQQQLAQHQATRNTQHISTPNVETNPVRSNVVTQPEWEAPRVLFATTSVFVTPAAGAERPLNAESLAVVPSVLRPATTLRTHLAGSRVVVALAEGQRVDLRSGASIRLNTATRAESTTELLSGEARVDVSQDGGRLSMIAHEWSFSAKNGSVVAKLDGESVRLSVLSGEVSVRFQGGAEQQLETGAMWVLSKTGASSKESTTVNDALALDQVLAHLSQDGSIVSMREFPHGTELSFADHVAIPGLLGAFRVNSAMVLHAHVGDDRWMIQVDPAQPIALNWVGRTAETPVSPTHQATTGHRVPTPAQVTLNANTLPEEARTAFRLTQQRLGIRTRSCFDRCERSNSCGSIQGMSPTIQLDGNGGVASVALSGQPERLLAVCIENSIRTTVRIPALANTRVNFGQFNR